MILKLKNIKLIKTEYGNDVVIKQIELRNDDGKFIKHIKLDNDVVRVLHNSKIKL
jgi:hypothetical protein